MSAVRSSGRTAGIAAILALLLVVLISPSALAQEAQIGIYNDVTRSSCSLSDASGGEIRAYVMVNTVGGMTGVRFAAPKPACFNAVWVADEVPSPYVFIGDSQTDISIATGACEPGLRHVLTIVFQKTSPTAPCCLFELQPAQDQASMQYLDCSFTEHPIEATPAYVNANATCSCTDGLDQPPSAPFNPNPVPYRINVPAQVLLTWEATDPENEALNFDVYLGTTNDPPLVADHVPQPSYNAGGLQYLTTYYWKVVARDSHGNTTTGPVWSFTTAQDSGFPPTPVSPTPLNVATNISRVVQLKWQLSGGNGPVFNFEVHFGTTNPPAVVDTIPAAQSPTYNPGPLALNTTYYWYVVSLGENGRRSQGGLWRFQTYVTDPPPTLPASPDPPDNSSGLELNYTLKWVSSDPEGQTVEYDVYFGTTSPPPLAAHTTSAHYDATNLSGSTHYYWKVIAFDSEGASTAGPEWDFTTHGVGPPTVPTLVAPANSSTISPHSVNVAWSSSDPEGGPLKFTLYRGTTPDPPPVATNVTFFNYSFGDLQPTTTYYWKVLAIDQQNLSTPGPVWSFTTRALVPPTVPGSPSPATGAFNISQTPTLTWECSDPDSQPLTYSILFNQATYQRSSPSFTPPYQLASLTTYSWRVTATDTDNNHTTGPVWTFTTGGTSGAPSTPNVIAPPNNATRLPTFVDLEWSATDPDGFALKYDVYFGTNPAPPRVLFQSPDTSFQVGPLAFGTTYYWRVVAKDVDSNYTTGPLWQFTTAEQTTRRLALGLYADASGTSCSLSDRGAGLRSVYVVLNGPSQYTAVRFAAAKPACFNATWMNDATPYVTIGNSQTDISIGFGQCLTPPVVAMSIMYMSSGDTQGCCSYQLDSPVIIGKMLVTDCSFAELIPRSEPVLGISSNDACPACATNGYLSVAETEDTCRAGAPHTITVDVKLNTTIDADNGGVDVIIDPQLQFVSCQRGSMIEDWGTFDYVLQQNVLTIAAAGTTIPMGTVGTFARLTFTTNCCNWNSAAEVGLTAPTGDFALNQLIGTHLGCRYSADGDVNDDGNITVADAQCALETYLYAPFEPPSDCGGPGAAMRADVDCSGSATPADAYCIFRNWLDQSCSFCNGTPPVNATAGPAPRLTLRAVRENEDVVVVLHAAGAGTVGALGFEIKYPQGIELVRVEPPRSDAFAALDMRKVEPGRVRIGAYANPGQALPANGDVVAIRFRVGRGAVSGTITALKFVDDLAGAQEVSTPLDASATTPVPGSVVLRQNSPNPFNPRTMIRFELPEPMHVRLAVFDVHGRFVKELLDERREAGASMVVWDGTDSHAGNVATGVYFYVLDAGGSRYQQKMVLLK